MVQHFYNLSKKYCDNYTYYLCNRLHNAPQFV